MSLKTRHKLLKVTKKWFAHVCLMLRFFSCKIKSNRLRLVKKNLPNMVFQAQLGTLWNKSERIAKLAVALAPITGANAADAEKAAFLLNAI